MDSAYNDHLPMLDKRDWSEFYPFTERKDPPDIPDALVTMCGQIVVD